MHQINSNTDPVLRTGVKKLITAFYDMVVRLGLVGHLSTQQNKQLKKMVVQTRNPFKKKNDIPFSGIVQGTSDEYSGTFGKKTGQTGTRVVSSDQFTQSVLEKRSEDHQVSDIEESNYEKKSSSTR